MNNFIYKNFKDYNIDDMLNIIENSYHKNITDDAIFKYGTIIDFIKTINNDINVFIEPGCQICSLSAYICKTCNVKNVHLYDFDNVSGFKINDIQRNLFRINNIQTNVNFKSGDFFANILNIENESVDLVIDGCSLTHFCGNDLIKNSGLNAWKNSEKILFQKLKKGGYFLISTDVKYHENINEINSEGEFVYPADILNIFSTNFNIVKTPILSNDIITNVLPYNLRVLNICLQRK